MTAPLSTARPSMTTSAEVTWQLDEITMHGTLTRPGGEGLYPGSSS